MDNQNDFYTVKQFKMDLSKMLDFVNLQLTRTLTPTETVYYKARRSALKEVQRMTKYMRDYNEIPGKDTT